MDGAERLRRYFDRAQQRTRWLGFPFVVMRKLGDDHGGALTTVVPHNAFLALFPLLLVVVTVLGFLLGRDSGFQQRVLGSAVAEFPIIGDQVQRNIHGLRGNGVGLVVGLLPFAWGARGLTQVAQHAMAEIWDIPSRQRPPLLGPAGPRAAAAPGFRRWPCRVEPADLAWQLRRAGSRGSTSQPRGRGGGERRAVPADVPGTYPSADPDPAADRWCAGRGCRLAGPAGRWWIPRRPLPAPRHGSGRAACGRTSIIRVASATGPAPTTPGARRPRAGTSRTFTGPGGVVDGCAAG